MYNNIGEKYLPIGTVVMLKGGKKRLMIIGFCVMPKNDEAKMYDYCGCLYPEGVISSEKNFFFNHSQIEKIYSFGYFDDEEKKFKDKLKKMIKKEMENSDNNSDDIIM